MDISEYKENFEVWNPSRNLNEQNWHSDTQDFEQNPYWVINRIRSKDSRTRTILSLNMEKAGQPENHNCRIVCWP